MSAIADVERIHNTWIQNERANAPTRVLELCSEQVRWLPPDGSAISGKREISTWLLNNPLTINRLEISQREVSVTGRLATLRARFEVHSVDSAGTLTVSEGQHQWVLEAEPDGQWRVLLISWVVEPD